MSSRRPQLHFILLLLTYYCPIRIAANGGNGTRVQCLPDQASSLLQLKHSFHNTNLSTWQQGSDCCHWEGVGCDRDSGQVITLDLSDRNLRSFRGLSPALFNLTSLTSLSLSGNDFGHINLPNFGFERLVQLLSLDLSDTSLAGQIPGLFATFSFLRYIDLWGNNFEGKLPTKIFQLENLIYLDFSYNPSLFVQLPNFSPGNHLESLDLWKTNCSGVIPDSFVHLKSEILGPYLHRISQAAHCFLHS